MVILPMGLNAKTKAVPVITLALTVVTIAVSLVYWKASHHYSVFISNDPNQLKLELEYRKVILSECDSHLPVETCQMLKDALRDDSERNFSVVQNEVNRALSDTVTEKQFMDALKLLSEKYPPPMAELLEAHPSLSEAASKRNSSFSEFQEKFQVFTQSHPAPLALLKAQFIHDGFFHLAFNLIFLFGFAAFVEQRLGKTIFLVTYLSSGFAGLLLQSQLANWEHTQILGASANIFGVAGAFTVLFFKHKINLLLSVFFVLFRKVQLNSLVYAGIFILLTEVTGVLKTTPSGVAHWAHLGGFATGALFALAFSARQKVEFPMAFPYEQELLQKALSDPDSSKSISRLLWLLSQNPSNYLALRALLKFPKFKSHPWSELNTHQQKVLQDAWEELSDDHQAAMLPLIPSSWPFYQPPKMEVAG